MADSDPDSDTQEKATLAGTIIGCIIGSLVIIGAIVLFFKYDGLDAVKGGLKKVSSVAPSIGTPGSSGGMRPAQWPWHIITPSLLIIFTALYATLYFYWKFNRGQFRSTPNSIAQLLRIKTGSVSAAIGGLTPVDESITAQLKQKPRPPPYNLISGGDSKTAMVNYRPLTVRLTGYLGGINGPLDGVFDMGVGIVNSLRLGARGFVFDIDYLDESPCQPVIVFRDDMGIMRSLHTGSVKEGMRAIAAYAFTGDKPNYDPILAMIYLRRIPPGNLQQTTFFKNIALAMDPISEYHLGQTNDGNFHNCISESSLFTTSITRFQKKIIVLVNYDTSQLPSQSNPKNSLHWWTNARMWLDPSGKSGALGSVTKIAPTSPPAYVHVGHIDHLLNVGSGQPTTDFQTSALNVFKVALGSPDYPYTAAQLTTLMNTLGIQCVPLDVLALGAKKAHFDTLNWKSKSSGVGTTFTVNAKPKLLNQLSNPQNPLDPLSFWTFGGWSRKMLAGETVDGFQDFQKEGYEDKDKAPVVQAQPIPGFIIPAPTPPKKPSPTLNSAGGVISIS